MYLAIALSVAAPGMWGAAVKPLCPSGIEKVSESFYVGRLKSRKLSVVMERIAVEDQLVDWRRYAKVQASPPAMAAVGGCLANRSSSSSFWQNPGSTFFEWVLAHKGYEELWTAYVTVDLYPELQIKKFAQYKIGDALSMREVKKQATPASRIKMFMSVVSSPSALLTSHMGISTSVENVLAPKSENNLSLALHAFAARVMLMRGPKRRFMLTCPMPNMAAIMQKSIKNSFVGMVKGGQNSMTFFEPHDMRKTWLKIDESNKKVYSWLFTGPFLPQYPTHYMAVSLRELAKRFFSREPFRL